MSIGILALSFAFVCGLVSIAEACKAPAKPAQKPTTFDFAAVQPHEL